MNQLLTTLFALLIFCPTWLTATPRVTLWNEGHFTVNHSITKLKSGQLQSIAQDLQLHVEKCECSNVYKPEMACNNIIDENKSTSWSSGGFAPQWFKLTLVVPHRVARISWVNQMQPNGEVTMEFKFYNSGAELVSTSIKTFDCISGETNVALFKDENLIDIKSIKITFTKSPSWIALGEVMVY